MNWCWSWPRRHSDCPRRLVLPVPLFRLAEPNYALHDARALVGMLWLFCELLPALAGTASARAFRRQNESAVR